ncbi:MAG: glucose-6-phosphate dehydrogenase, partial [Gemmatimonadota bacterium]
RLASVLDEICGARDIPGNLVFHLALPPRFFPDAVRGLDAADLSHSDRGWRRLVIEKPFGSDFESARALDTTLRASFDEEQIYRVDHFLGKETVQNMLAFRFANAAFEPVWNSNYIDHVQITVAEDIGIGDRAGFYEDTGVIRDMVQNHLLQLVCMTALEPPVTFDARSLRDETAKVLQAVNVQPVDLETGVVTGQYGPGEADGRRVPGYQEEKDVDPGSRTPTFAALELSLDNARWAGVPFYLRTGKRLKRKLTEVAIQFAPVHHHVFPGAGPAADSGNLLIFRLQPDEAIARSFLAKRPGPGFALDRVSMHFDYAEAFGIEHPPRAYAWLLHDVMRGDQTLFARSDWILEAWRVVDPVIAQWENVRPPSYPNYAAGSWGPEAANELIRRDGREWLESD